MTPILASIVCAAACSATLMISAASCFAAPGAATAKTLEALSARNSVFPIQYRERFDGRGGRGERGNRGGDGLAIGIGAAIIGGIVLSEAARAEHRRTHGGDWQRCATSYRSFDPGTGLYTGYDGARHTCPYLQ